MPCRAMPNAWPPPLQAALPSAHATGIVIPNRTVPAATPRSIFIPPFIRTSLVNESPCRSNSSVLRLHPFIHQVAPTRKKVTHTGQVEQRSNPGTTDQRANVSLHRIAIIDTGCPPHRSMRKLLIILGDVTGRTGYCARRVLGTNTHRPSINHLI